MSLISLSSGSLFIAFFFYVFAAIAFFISLTGRKWRGSENPQAHTLKWGKRGFVLTLIAFALHALFEILRWIAGGHAPTSNMFEFTSFLAFAIILAFLIIYRIYKLALLGIIVLPLTIILIAYASVFPTKVEPLIPALQSYWLYIHVTVAAMGEGAFAVGFAAGFMYLLHKVDQSKPRIETRLLEMIMWVVHVVLAFVVLAFLFRGIGYTDQYAVVDQWGKEQTVTYTMPSIVSPHEGKKLTDTGFGPFFETPGWMKGANAGNKFNTIIWSVLVGTLLYLLSRLIARKRLSMVLHKRLNDADLDAETIDEISYRAIAIGFPIFTLGALIFAMIWAAEAWGRPWGWDPKEVWALITWLFYSVYLHLRLSIGWHGKKSAWMATLGFVIVMFTLVGVNLIISGLHSYA
jgi:cytochrome c-type biogenesis protein CcsB